MEEGPAPGRSRGRHANRVRNDTPGWGGGERGLLPQIGELKGRGEEEEERKSLRGQRQRRWVCEGVGGEADD